ncbi:hypothetical protein GCM10027592_60770 [Spirosoma flavus]
MNKLIIFCLILLAAVSLYPLMAQTRTTLFMGIANDQLNGTFNTVYGFRDNIPGATDAPSYAHGQGNTLVGANASNYTNGSDNTSIGFNAGGWFLSGSQNVFIGSGVSAQFGGSDSPTSNTRIMKGNSFVGYGAGYYNRADYNVFIGYQSGYSNVTGIRNVFVGSGTGYANTGGDNAFLGYQAGQNNSTGTDNTFVGSLAGRSTTTGQFNSFVGSYTGQANTTGRLNTFMGYGTGSNNSSGGVNTFVGSFAGAANTTGKQNTFLGYSSGLEVTVGSNDILVGYQAGQHVTTGNNNIVIGPSSGTALIDGNDNVLMGYNSQVASSNLQNAVALGTNARVALSNAIVLGDPTNTSIAVGIGTDSPQYPLDVRGTINLRNNGRIKFAHLSNPVRQGATDQFLTVNEQGETVLARYQLRINNPGEWSDKVFSPTYQLPTLPDVATYVALYGHLPGVPSAEQVAKEGIDLVKMNATLLEKVEELTLYSIQQDKKVNQYKREVDELKALVRQVLERK